MKRSPLHISHTTIWVSAVTLGLLSSVPQLASHKFNVAEAAVNAGITAAFAVLMWYFNIYMLSRKKDTRRMQSISYTKLLSSLSFGLVIMFGLAWVQQLILSHINFGPTMLMVEVRGILINLVFYMFLNLLQQNYENQHVSMELDKIKSDNLAAQYELLKQQINPHFLFNSLNTLKAMVETGDKEAVDFILKLSNFYRFTLESRKLDLIHVHEEMEIINAYLFLQKARFEEGLKFTSTLTERTLKTLIPPFTLQLLIENCIKHNVVSLSRPLYITIYEDGEYIIVENVLQVKKGDVSSTSVGLKNIGLRYSHLLDKNIEITNDDKTFKVKLPLIYEHHNH
ncbi:sensor histidine kinase [Mucilaginibacter myungsuensis]|uniref:Sensor histidine kinase n=1 Tax=Mucilaginibacter myungsuensis TaxID=649104 RepID=A0A929L4F8_9SPHI|nr:sensor histidine kinase [Mucilaginibacter myungsuensis]MBE9663046.1 sensor histidine kinase [Mucilaginibacter myungsuensis]MDN3598680.1 sensor histidine kinase [Mucilaginibacter myungsuensis]